MEWRRKTFAWDVVRAGKQQTFRPNGARILRRLPGSIFASARFLFPADAQQSSVDNFGMGDTESRALPGDL